MHRDFIWWVEPYLMETIEFDLQIEDEQDPLRSNWEDSVIAILTQNPDPRLIEQYDSTIWD